MKIKKLFKRITSAVVAVAVSAAMITGTLASAAPDPNPISTTPTNISFSITEGHISATSVRNVYGVRNTGASLTAYTKLTHTQEFWIIKPNNQIYSNLCINPNAGLNSGTQPYYAYQVMSDTMEANSSYWEDLDDNVKYTIGLIMHYGFPNGNKGGFALGGGQDSHGAACFEATQMLIWEAVTGMRVLPPDYRSRKDKESGFYSSYASTQWHYTNGVKDYQYSPLIDFFTKADTADLQNTINYYKWLVDKVAHHIDIPENTYKDDITAKANPTTLKYNSSTKRYEATITTNEALFEDIGARTAIGNIGLNVTKQSATAANGDAKYIIHTANYFSGMKVTAKMEKNSTKQHTNETGLDGLQIWAGKYTATDTNDINIQQNVTGSFSDPARAFMAFNAEEVRGDFTVVKKSLKSNGDEDAVLVESVRKDARFMVYDVAAQRYIKTSIDAQGNYQYVSSDGFSNTSTDAGTIFKLNADGKFTVTNLPLGKTFRVIEYETAAHYEIPKAAIEVTLDETNKSQIKEQPNKRTKSLYVSKRVLAASDDKNHINGKELAGASMAIVAEDGTTFATWASDGKEHLVEDIPAGKYTLKELAAPDGYQIATDISFEVDENNKVTATGATVESKDDIPIIVMFDEVTRTQISKKDATTGKELKGAELTLYDWNNNEVESWTSTDKPHVIYGLVVGKTYTLRENLAPIGYAKTTDVTFKIEGVDKNGKPVVTKCDMLDEVAKGTIKVTKRSENNKNIENIKFILEGTTQTGEAFTTSGFTDANGVVEFVVPTGIYKVTEDKDSCPTAYIVAESKDNVTVEYAKVTNIEFLNNLKKGSIKVQKRSENNKNIENIKFILEGKSDADDDIRIESTTDAQGVAEFKDVPIGTYTITEDGESCPTAYMVCEPQSVTVEYAKVTDVSFLNNLKKGSIKVQKKTKDMTHIEGITFTLSGKSDAGDDISIEGKTNAQGVVEFKDVPIGTYKITESGVPAGYLVADPQNVTVLYAQTVEATFVNEEQPERPPVPTGYNGNSTMVLVMLAAVSALACGAFIVKRKEEK